jgi:uncharacterized phage-associated protein
MIRFLFNEVKTTQAAAFLLKKNGGKMNYMKLIKLLYLADREALSRWERPITGDSYVSMDNGPVLSKVLDKINSGGSPFGVKSYWHEYISSPDNYNIKLLKKKSEYEELSPRERELLISILIRYKKYNKWQMVEICHKILPEWNNPYGTSIPIRIEDILKAIKRTERDIELIEDEVDDLNYVRSILSAK